MPFVFGILPQRHAQSRRGESLPSQVDCRDQIWADTLLGREFLNFMADLYSITPVNRNRRIDDLLHLFEIDERSIRVLTYAWAGRQWAQIADRRFPRGLEPLATIG